MIKRDTVIAFSLRVLLIAILVIAFLFWIIFDPANSSKRFAGAAAFDHSVCQYPNRLSNPANGCDNSDPANPECMKYGTEICDDVNGEKVMSTTVSDEKIDSAALDELISSAMGGK